MAGAGASRKNVSCPPWTFDVLADNPIRSAATIPLAANNAASVVLSLKTKPDFPVPKSTARYDLHTVASHDAVNLVAPVTPLETVRTSVLRLRLLLLLPGSTGLKTTRSVVPVRVPTGTVFV